MPGKQESEALRWEQIAQAVFHVATCKGLEQLTMRLTTTKAGLNTELVFSL